MYKYPYHIVWHNVDLANYFFEEKYKYFELVEIVIGWITKTKVNVNKKHFSCILMKIKICSFYKHFFKLNNVSLQWKLEKI